MTDRRPIGICQFGSKGSGAKSKSRRVFGARTIEARGERETTACVRVPVNNKLAVTRYKLTRVALDISLQSRYVDTRRYIYI